MAALRTIACLVLLCTLLLQVAARALRSPLFAWYLQALWKPVLEWTVEAAAGPAGAASGGATSRDAADAVEAAAAAAAEAAGQLAQFYGDEDSEGGDASAVDADGEESEHGTMLVSPRVVRAALRWALARMSVTFVDWEGAEATRVSDRPRAQTRFLHFEEQPDRRRWRQQTRQQDQQGGAAERRVEL